MRAYGDGDVCCQARPRRRWPYLLTCTAVVAAAVALTAAIMLQQNGVPDVFTPQAEALPAPAPVSVAMPAPEGWLDPAALGMPPTRLAGQAPLGDALTRAPAPPGAAPERPAQEAARARPPWRDMPPEAALSIPLPPPRPFATEPALRPPPPARARLARPSAPPAPEDNRSFLARLFGLGERPASPAMAYAVPQDEAADLARTRRLGQPAGPDGARGTAVYDISRRTVTLPNGEKLEAHSGLGQHLDDPRFVHVRMRGATPPHTYELSERETLFHGVRAIRLTPVGGSGAIHGRAGLLAHSYMLGPNGDSNGCVSIRDYDRFLRAFLRGEVTRLVVIAGGPAPTLASN